MLSTELLEKVYLHTVAPIQTAESALECAYGPLRLLALLHPDAEDTLGQWFKYNILTEDPEVSPKQALWRLERAANETKAYDVGAIVHYNGRPEKYILNWGLEKLAWRSLMRPAVDDVDCKRMPDPDLLYYALALFRYVIKHGLVVAVENFCRHYTFAALSYVSSETSMDRPMSLQDVLQKLNVEPTTMSDSHPGLLYQKRSSHRTLLLMMKTYGMQFINEWLHKFKISKGIAVVGEYMQTGHVVSKRPEYVSQFAVCVLRHFRWEEWQSWNLPEEYVDHWVMACSAMANLNINSFMFAHPGPQKLHHPLYQLCHPENFPYARAIVDACHTEVMRTTPMLSWQGTVNATHSCDTRILRQALDEFVNTGSPIKPICDIWHLRPPDFVHDIVAAYRNKILPVRCEELDTAIKLYLEEEEKERIRRAEALPSPRRMRSRAGRNKRK